MCKRQGSMLPTAHSQKLFHLQVHCFQLETVNISIQFSHSVVSDFLQPLGLSMSGFPVHHQLPELTQTHVHHISDAIQPSHPLSSPSPRTFNPSQHQGLFQGVSSLYQVAKVLEQYSVNTVEQYSMLMLSQRVCLF